MTINEEFENLIKARTPTAQCIRAENGEYIVPVIQTMWEGYRLRQPEIERLRQEITRLRESGRKIIEDHTERTKEAILLREERDALRSDLGFRTMAFDAAHHIDESAQPHVYKGRLEAILSVIQRYLPPDGISKDAALSEIISLVDPMPTPPAQEVEPVAEGCHKLDTHEQVFFYEQDFYVLSNFSAFSLEWRGMRFDTSEAAYHYEKFPRAGDVRRDIMNAPSAHEAFKIAERNKARRRDDWDAVKVDVMREILHAKIMQHEYVRRKLLATGDRELIEDSWRDDFWGWGKNKDGQNMLGKLWMEIRQELRAALKGES